MLAWFTHRAITPRTLALIVVLLIVTVFGTSFFLKSFFGWIEYVLRLTGLFYLWWALLLALNVVVGLALTVCIVRDCCRRQPKKTEQWD